MTRASSAWAGRRVTVIASFDSFLRAGARYATHFEARGATVRHQLVLARAHQVSANQLERFGLSREVRTLPMATAASRENLEREDLVILALDGLRSRRFYLRMHRAFASADRRPIALSLYPGVIFRFHLEGMTSRMAADVLALNSPADLALYEGALAGMGLENRNGMCLGLSFLPSLDEPVEESPPAARDIVFAAQPTVPAGRTERLYVVHRLAELARANPETRVLLKPRHRRNETTLHRVDHHYEDLLAELGRNEPLPDNLVVTHVAMEDLLETSGLVLSFSSTAAVEAIVRRVPTRILTDIGVHENIGNHFFLGSDLLAAFDDIRPDMPHRVNEAWLANHVGSAADHMNDLEARLDELLTEQEALRRALPPPYPRLIGRCEAFERFTETRDGWQSVAELGTRGPSGWRGRLRRTARPLAGLVYDGLSRSIQRRIPSKKRS